MSPTRRTALVNMFGASLAHTQYQGLTSPTEKPPLQAVSQWVRNSAIPIRTTNPSSELDDLAPLKQLVGDARIVALGEASHGAREFFQLKHRIVELLVTQLGFSILAIEANMPEAFRLNDYLLTGQGDVGKLLKALSPIFNTREFLALILWMREYNGSNKGRVLFSGFDMQDPRLAISNLREFIAKAEARFLPELEKASKRVLSFNPQHPHETVLSEWREVIAKLNSFGQTPGARWAVQNARIILQFLQYASNLMNPQASMSIRDASMAANVDWILNESRGAKILLWAHNFHVMTAHDPMGVEVMGARLRKRYQDQLVTFGFTFQQGSFQAFNAKGDAQEFSVTSLPEGSLDATLGAGKLPLFALDLRTASRSDSVAAWLGQKHATRNIMAGYTKDSPGFTIFEQVPRGTYDCLVFVDRITPAQRNENAG